MGRKSYSLVVADLLRQCEQDHKQSEEQRDRQPFLSVAETRPCHPEKMQPGNHAEKDGGNADPRKARPACQTLHAGAESESRASGDSNDDAAQSCEEAVGQAV